MWDYMLDNLFCEKTNLFYDFIVPEKRGRFEEYLPSPELIRAQIPNPCGWGTGMEDGDITGGVMLGAAIDAFYASGNETFASYAKKFFKGLRTCASISDSEGFLARNVSPVDGKTHYIDSSRDQYTYWVHAASKYYESELSDEDERAFIRSTLRGFAKRALNNTSESTGCNLQREDGRPGIVVQMWKNICPHEAMRLPMIYLAAWKIGQAESFRDAYLELRDEALKLSEMIRFESCCRMFALNQMQLSLKFLYDHDDDPQFKQRCLALIDKLAEYAREIAVKKCENDLIDANREIVNYKARSWDRTPAAFNGYFEGYPYYVPMQFKSLAEGAPIGSWLIKDIGDAIIIALSSPNAKYDNELAAVLEKTISYIDLSEHTSDAPAILLEAYYAQSHLQ